MNRRQFLHIAAGSAAALARAPRAHAAFAQTQPLRKFAAPLRTLAQMAPAVRLSRTAPPGSTPVDYYEIALRPFTDQLHPDLPPTRLWGYGNRAGGAFKHLGGTIVADAGVAVRIRFFNELPNTHILPVDNTVPGLSAAAAAHVNRAAVHLHGGNVAWPSDGGPHAWFTPRNAATGSSFVRWLPDAAGNPTADFWYPNLQSARLLWFHDHALGNTRLNAYAGLASAYIIRDSIEQSLIADGAIPALEIPVIIQDKVFTSARTADTLSTAGDLWYPRTYDTEFFDLEPGGLPLPPYSLVPEFWGDTMLCNGTVFPFVEVQPRRYRLRILNACNTRFVRLKLVGAQGKVFPDSAEPDVGNAGPALQLIGNEAGFLDGGANPQGVLFSNDRRSRALVLAPAERADVIIDFSDTKPGTYWILHNDAPVPFPGGTPLGDFFPENRRLPTPPSPGYGPNTRTLLQFRVVPPTAADAPAPRNWSLPRMNRLAPLGVLDPPPGIPIRDLTLNEAVDEYGRLSQLLGAVGAGEHGRFGLPYDAAATETPRAGSIEVWRISNLSADAHPIHFHLVNVQVLARQRIHVHQFGVDHFTGTPAFRGRPEPPYPEEMGWKETVRMNPGEATTVIMKFDLPPNPVVPVNGVPTAVAPPASPRTGGHEYVWHCHILEHEEHEMMRPLVVQP